MPIKFLISREQYLANGLHIGAKQVSKKMREFVFQIRKDGLAIFNLRKIDERIRAASKFLARKDKILVVGKKSITHSSIKKFAELVNAKAVVERYMPGTLTNPNLKDFYEADVLIVTDLISDERAVKDAVKANVPIIAICDTNYEIGNVDFVIPGNNKGKRSIALIFWLLAREILKERGKIKSDKEFVGLEEFLKD